MHYDVSCDTCMKVPYLLWRELFKVGGNTRCPFCSHLVKRVSTLVPINLMPALELILLMWSPGLTDRPHNLLRLTALYSKAFLIRWAGLANWLCSFKTAADFHGGVINGIDDVGRCQHMRACVCVCDLNVHQWQERKKSFLILKQ